MKNQYRENTSILSPSPSRACQGKGSGSGFFAVLLLLSLQTACPALIQAQTTPIIISHRGASGYLPEHTLAAKVLAYGMGADYIEQDVVLTADNIPVVLHDIHLDTVTDVKEKYPDRISWVLGNGLIYSLIFKLPNKQEPDTKFPSMVSEKAMQKGLLVVHTGRESIKLAPPLTISDDAIREGVEVLDECIHEVINY